MQERGQSSGLSKGIYVVIHTVKADENSARGVCSRLPLEFWAIPVFRDGGSERSPGSCMGVITTTLCTTIGEHKVSSVKCGKKTGKSS